MISRKRKKKSIDVCETNKDMASEVPIPPSSIQSSVGGLQLCPTRTPIHCIYSSGPSFSKSHSLNKMWAQIILME